MKKVFLDTNVLLDAIQKRKNFVDAASIIQAGKDGELELCVSVISFPTIAYVMRTETKETIYQILNSFSDSMTVLPTDSTMFQKALKAEADDFEDMLQYQTAIAYHCDVLITNNIKDFPASSTIKIQTAKDFLVEFDSENTPAIT